MTCCPERNPGNIAVSGPLQNGADKATYHGLPTSKVPEGIGYTKTWLIEYETLPSFVTTKNAQFKLVSNKNKKNISS